LAFGDIANDTQAAGETALVYSSADDAKKAAEILPKRMAAYTSLVNRRSLTEIMTDRGVTQPDVQVVESNGQYVVLISFVVPKLSDDDILSMTEPAADTGTGAVNPPGLVYRFLVASAMQRDLGWLTTVPREILEAAAK